MSPDASRKVAFVTHEGLFQFPVMPFGALQHAGNLQEAHGPGPVRHALVVLFSIPR